MENGCGGVKGCGGDAPIAAHVLIEIDPQGIEALDDRKDLMDIVGDWHGIGVDKEPLVAVAVEDIAVHNENVFVCAV